MTSIERVVVVSANQMKKRNQQANTKVSQFEPTAKRKKDNNQHCTTCKKAKPETMTMIATTMMLALLLALSSTEAMIHRRAAGTELYRVQPTQKVMPTTTTTVHAATDFETIDVDAKRALRELMVGGRQLEEESSMEYILSLSLSYAPIMSMTPPPTMLPTSDGTRARIEEDPTDDESDDDNNAAPITTAGNNGSTNKDFNKPATISVTVFLLIAAMAVTALVVRKYKRAVMMANGSDDLSMVSGPSVFTNVESSVGAAGVGQNLPSPI
jgi:hypothetical protein